MKNIALAYVLFLGVILLIACGKPQGNRVITSAGEIINREAWRLAWKTAVPYDDVTVNLGEAQKTYVPEQENFVFLAVTTQIANISRETQEIHLPKGLFYVVDQEQNKYDLVGIAKQDTILMSPPYLLEDNTFFSTTTWDQGFVTVAYQFEQGTWYIQATSGAAFHVDFLFVVPRDISNLALTFGDGMFYNLH